MNFETPDMVDAFRTELDRFIELEVKPLESEYDQFLGETGEQAMVDEEGKVVDEYLEVMDKIQRKSVEAGFYTMQLPERVGGGGLNLLEFTMMMEHLHDRHPDGFHEDILDVLSVTPALVPCYEDEFQREKYFDPVMNADKHLCFGLTEPDHGSDITHMDTSAERDGDEWVINGTKCFISNSTFADAIMVHARTSGEAGSPHGISTFLVDRSNPGWKMGKVQRPMGGDVGRHAFNHFDDCRVPEEQMVGDEGEGFMNAAMRLVGWTRLHLTAKCVGRAQWLFDQCVEYAQQRESFGEPIGNRQSIKNMLAELRTDIEQTRWLYRHAAWRLDRNERARWEQSAAWLRGGQLWNRAADIAIQIHGGSGFFKTLPFESEYRAARGARIYDGTDEIQRRTIANEFLDL
jgi:alkylation response protein AidB-like acyl-CoA dehydrogenase